MREGIEWGNYCGAAEGLEKGNQAELPPYRMEKGRRGGPVHQQRVVPLLSTESSIDNATIPASLSHVCTLSGCNVTETISLFTHFSVILVTTFLRISATCHTCSLEFLKSRITIIENRMRKPTN